MFKFLKEAASIGLGVGLAVTGAIGIPVTVFCVIAVLFKHYLG